MTRTWVLPAALSLVSCDDTVYGTPHNGSTDSGVCEGYEASWDGMVALFSDHCESCHANGVQPEFTTTELEADLASEAGLFLVAGDASASLLYQRLTGDPSPMPPNGELDTCYTDPIKTWIDAGALAYTADWEGVKAFYEAECGFCHNDGTTFQSQFTPDDWEADLTDGTGLYFVAGDAAASPVWQRLAELDGAAPMPDGNALPSREIRHVEIWLDAGAPLD